MKSDLPVRYSIIVPVYNRPDEIGELLESLALSPSLDRCQLIIIEDGSRVPCREVVDRFSSLIDIRYQVVPNGGPSKARNIGARCAEGEWLIFWDSDVVVPKDYFIRLDADLERTPTDAFGGPDAALDTFSDIQKAINYSMTSPLTTGGIRGGEKRATSKYYPRTFNLGVRREAFEKLNGFAEDMRFGEDIDFGMRLYENGFVVSLFTDAFVFHKRRVDFSKFFRQVFHFGKARVHLTHKHPGTMKWVYLLPSLFVVIATAMLIKSFVFLALALLFVLVMGIDALRRTHHLKVALLAVVASVIQLVGYGSGYLWAAFRYYLLGRRDFK